MTEFVDVGGYRVAAYARGEQSPTVVFVAGCEDAGDYWSDVLDVLDPAQKAITYDRAGLGKSEPRLPHDRLVTYRSLVEELQAVLKGMQIAGPLVLVGHSLGGSIIRAFAMKWPEQVAGLVLVDTSLIEQSDAESAWVDGIGDADTFTRIDVQRGTEELRGESFPDVPVVVLSRGPEDYIPGGPLYSEVAEFDCITPEFEALWQQTHRELAAKARATQVIANGVGHDFPHKAPALVALSVEAVVRAALTGSVLELDQAAVSAVSGDSVVVSTEMALDS